MTKLSDWAGAHNRFRGQIALAKQVTATPPKSLTTDAAALLAAINEQLCDLEGLLLARHDPDHLKEQTQDGR